MRLDHVRFILWTLLLIGLYVASRYNYLLFHNLATLFRVFIACGIFMVAWNSRKIQYNHYLLFLGVAYLFIGMTDMLHAFSYKGMGVFPAADAGLSTQLRVAARFMESFSLLVAPVFLKRKLRTDLLFAAYSLIFAFLLVSIFRWDVFLLPAQLGTGPALPKKTYEYAISFVFASALCAQFLGHTRLDRDILRLIMAAIALGIGTELAYSLRADTYGFFNLAGHFLKIVSFYLIYKAFIVTGLTRPYDLIFRDLKQSEERFRKVYENAPLAFIIWDRDRRITGWNECAEKMFGWSAADVMGRNFPEFMVSEEDRSKVEEAVDSLLQGTATNRTVVKNLTKSGNVVLCEWNNSIFYDKDGNIAGAISLGLDITEQRKAHEALREREQSYRTLSENLPGIVYRVFIRKDNHMEFFNDMVEPMTGYSVNELKKGEVCSIDSLILPDDSKKVISAVKRAVKADEPFEVEYRIRDKKGSIKHLLERGRPIRDKDGRPVYVDGVIFDITERKKAEDALRKSSEKIKLFAYSVSHDLKSPSIAIHGITQRLNKQFRDSLPEKAKMYCDTIVKSSEQLAVLVEKINAFISAGEAPLTFEKINLKEIIKTVRQEFVPQLRSRGITFIEPESLPEIWADRLGLLRILRNLVDNALKYGGENLSEIEIGYKQAEEHHILSVRDDGIGIPTKNSKKIFERFKREDSSKGVPGAGLGLAIVKEIAEHHGGSVWIEPGEEKGVTFFVSICKKL